MSYSPGCPSGVFLIHSSISILFLISLLANLNQQDSPLPGSGWNTELSLYFAISSPRQSLSHSCIREIFGLGLNQETSWSLYRHKAMVKAECSPLKEKKIFFFSVSQEPSRTIFNTSLFSSTLNIYLCSLYVTHLL